MAAVQAQMENAPPVRVVSSSMIGFLIRLAGVAVLDVMALWLGLGVGHDGNWFLAVAIFLAAIGATAINLVPSLWPLRWMAPGLVLMALLAIYPLFYTVYIAFTNFSDGHRYTQSAAVALMAQEKYLAPSGTSYKWSVFRTDDGTYALWLTGADGSTFFAVSGQPLVPVTPNQSGDAPYDKSGIPASLNGYKLLTGGDRFKALKDIQTMEFGTEDAPVGIRSATEAGAFSARWVFDPAQNALIDKEMNTAYIANDSTGDFIAANGDKAPLGYWVPIGLRNFTRVFNDIGISGPLVRVFIWTIAFAFFSVLTSFALGLLVALVLNKDTRVYKFIKSLLIIPYAVPGVISIIIWRGMLNPNGGVITSNMVNILGWAPPWYTDAGWAKVAIILVNLWLSFPYFMLISSGALQSIPSSIYEAAEVDGANAWHRFWKLTLPLLLVAVGPLLIGSFIFNFNNFLIIEAMFQGGPTMIGTNAPPVGHTDNLISYTYRFAFGSGGTRDFGFASAIAIIIFFIVGILSLVQFRLSKRFEEIGENA